jgi:uncharacterized protein YdcH (DUF465 family)
MFYNKKIKKGITYFFGVVIICSVIFTPQRTQAQNTDPAQLEKEFSLDTIATAMAQTFLDSLTRDIVNWINSGFDGDPMFVQNTGDFLFDVANETSGQFIDDLGYGYLCEPFGLQIQIALATQNTFRQRAQCTVLDVIDNYDAFIDDFSQGGWAGWISVTQNPQNNAYGAYLLARSELDRRIARSLGFTKDEINRNKGFYSQKVCVEYDKSAFSGDNCTYNNGICIPNDPPECKKWQSTTLGNIVENELNSALNLGKQKLVVADEINEVISALINYSVNRIRTGIASSSGRNYGFSNVGTGKYYSSSKVLPEQIKNTEDLKKIAQEIKYKLYDYRIIRLDSRFKPYKLVDDVKEYDEEYTRLYEVFGKEIDDQNRWEDHQYEEGKWNFGILAYSDTNDTKNSPGYEKGDGKYDGYDMIDKSPRVGPPNEAELYYKYISVQRAKEMIDEYTDVKITATKIRADYITKAEDLYKTDPKIKTICRFMDKTGNADEIITMANNKLRKSTREISEIKDYFSDNGTYDSLLNSVNKIEDSIKNISDISDPEDPENSKIQILGQQIQRIQFKMPDITLSIVKRIEDMVHYNATNNKLSGETNLHCWIEGGTEIPVTNDYDFNSKYQRRVIEPALFDDIQTPADLCTTKTIKYTDKRKKPYTEIEIPLVGFGDYSCNKYDVEVQPGEELKLDKWACSATCLYEKPEDPSDDNGSDTSGIKYINYSVSDCIKKVPGNEFECQRQGGGIGSSGVKGCSTDINRNSRDIEAKKCMRRLRGWTDPTN